MIRNEMDNDAQDLKYKKLFQACLNDIRESVDHIDPLQSIGDRFFDVMKFHLIDFFDLKFVKYIHIFNGSGGSGRWGNVEFYADLFHSVCGTNKIRKGKELVTRDRCRVDIKNGRKYFERAQTAIDLLFSGGRGVFDLDNDRIFDICHNGNEPIDKGSSFNSELVFKWMESQKLYKIKGYWKDWGQDISIIFVRDLLSNYKSVDEITNSFIFCGHKMLSETDESTRKYSVCVVVGIDNRKAETASIRSFLLRFQDFIDMLSRDILEDVRKHHILQPAVDASIGQAMRRNMSHNVGAHVLARFTSDGTYERMADEFVKQNQNNYISSVDDDSVFPEGKNLQLPLFMQYLNDRMDYLSESAFNTSTVLTTKCFYGEIFKEFDRARILLNHLSGISGFKYRVVLKHNGELMSDTNDLAVALPDVFGDQAIFNIIENVIRNTAKHSARVDNNLVDITLDISEDSSFPEFYCIEIDNGVQEEDVEKLVQKQNETLNASVLGEDMKLRTYGLGLLEMSVATAVLRQVEISKITSYEYRFADSDKIRNQYGNLILLKAINKDGALGYRFFLQKPKEILFVGDFGIEPANQEALAKEGIHVIGEDAFVKAVESGESFAHPFLFYPDSITGKTRELLSEESDSKTLLTARKISLTAEDVKEMIDIIKTSSSEGLLSRLKDHAWQLHYERNVLRETKNPSNRSLEIRVSFDPMKGRDSFVNNQVVFLDHSDRETHAKGWRRAGKGTDFEAWIENLSSRASAKLPGYNKYSVDDGESNPVCVYVDNIRKEASIKYEIFEAYHNKVVILDERVQRFAQEREEGSSTATGGHIPCSELFKSTNVHIPETALDPVAFDEEKVQEIEHYVEENSVGAFVVIHYGILERMYKGNENRVTAKLNEWAKKAKRVIVTSGRGAHSLTIPPSVCFASLPSVLYAFTENRNKFIINYLLNQSRRKSG